MGYGDELIASGQARGAKARGKRIAFGAGVFIDHHPFAKQIHKGNPNVAFPGEEGSADLEWVANHRGSRPYNRNAGDHWEYVEGFGDRPGEIYFDAEELKFASKQGSGFILVEPSVPAFKAMAFNKQWPWDRYVKLVVRLQRENFPIAQFEYPPPFGPVRPLPGARLIKAPTFRHAAAVLKRAAMYVGPEGGLHHASAAVGTPAVVIFGGFISPRITGYSNHHNLYAGGKPCGSFRPCSHCREAMASISVDDVMDGVMHYQLSVA